MAARIATTGRRRMRFDIGWYSLVPVSRGAQRRTGSAVAPPPPPPLCVHLTNRLRRHTTIASTATPTRRRGTTTTAATTKPGGETATTGPRETRSARAVGYRIGRRVAHDGGALRTVDFHNPSIRPLTNLHDQILTSHRLEGQTARSTSPTRHLRQGPVAPFRIVLLAKRPNLCCRSTSTSRGCSSSMATIRRRELSSVTRWSMRSR